MDDATEAAKRLRESLNAPPSVLTVSVWLENGQTSLMVRILPQWAGKIKVPRTMKVLEFRFAASYRWVGASAATSLLIICRGTSGDGSTCPRVSRKSKRNRLEIGASIGRRRTRTIARLKRRFSPYQIPPW